MAIRLNWRRVQRAYKRIKQRGYSNNAPVVFTLLTSDGVPRRTEILFKDFLRFFWTLSESKELKVISILVENKAGIVLYRHKRVNKGNEEIPNGGNIKVVAHWNALTPNEQSMYTKMMISQINAYDK